MAPGPRGADRLARRPLRGEKSESSVSAHAGHLHRHGQADVASQCLPEERHLRRGRLRSRRTRRGYSADGARDEQHRGRARGLTARTLLDDRVSPRVRAVRGPGQVHLVERPVLRRDAGPGRQDAAAFLHPPRTAHSGRVRCDPQRGRGAPASPGGRQRASQRPLQEPARPGNRRRPPVPGRIGRCGGGSHRRSNPARRTGVELSTTGDRGAATALRLAGVTALEHQRAPPPPRQRDRLPTADGLGALPGVDPRRGVRGAARRRIDRSAGHESGEAAARRAGVAEERGTRKSGAGVVRGGSVEFGPRHPIGLGDTPAAIPVSVRPGGRVERRELLQGDPSRGSRAGSTVFRTGGAEQS